MRKTIILTLLLLFFLFSSVLSIFAAVPIIHSITPDISLSNPLTSITIRGKNFEVNPKVIISDGSLNIRGSFNTPDSASNVDILGNYAYVADNESGLQIIDISVPSNPVLAGTYDAGGYVYDVTISGKYAYIAAGGEGLQVLDIKTPAKPLLIKRYQPSDFSTVKSVEIDKNFAYILSGIGGDLYIVDIGNPEEPVAVGKYDSYGSIYGIAISGNNAYLANGYNGLQILDISNPSKPIWVAEYDNSSSAEGLVIVGKYAYIAYSYKGLQVLDIANPSQPILVGEYDATSAYDLRISGTYAYIANYNGLLALDISDPTNPYKVGTCETPGSAKALAISGDFAYIADGTSGLQVIGNINYPADPFLVGEYGAFDSAETVEISGDYAYVVDSKSGLHILNVSSPAKPILVGKANTPGSAMDVKLSGNYAYVADGSSGVQVVDISNKSKPLRVGVHNTSGKGKSVYATSLVVSGGYAYIACGKGYISDFDGLEILDISNPMNPLLVGEYETGSSAYDVAVSGGYAYVVNGYKGLKIINIKNPASPSLVGEYAPSGSAIKVSILGKYAYISYPYSNALQIVDISNPVSPEWIGEILLDSVYDFEIQGDLIYIIGRKDSYRTDLLVGDISNPLNPLLVAEYNIPNWSSGSGITISGKYVYITAGSDGLQIFNPVYKATSVKLVDSETIKCQLPYGLEERFYNVTVVNSINGEKEIFSNAFESKNTLEENYTDADLDGFYAELDDCNDNSTILNPNTAWYQDLDEDNYGNPSVFLTQCSQPDGYTLDNTDPDDKNYAITGESDNVPTLNGGGFILLVVMVFIGFCNMKNLAS